jgi:ankyrin repeat protein
MPPSQDPLARAYDALRKIEEEDGANTDPAADLVLAAYMGDVDRARDALDRGASPDSLQAKTGQSALWLAVAGDHLGVVKLLCERGADPLIELKVKKQVFTPLMRAEAEEKTDIVSVLTQALAKSQKGAKTKKKIRPELSGSLAMAVWDKAVARVNELLAAGADPNATTAYDEPVLSYAARAGLLEIARALLAAGADPNRYDAKSGPLLHDAVMVGQLEMARLLLEGGADPNAVHKKEGVATRLRDRDKSYRAMLQLLIAHGWDVNQNAYDRPILYNAIRDGHEDVVELLLAHGANVNQRIKYDVRPWEGLYSFESSKRLRLLDKLIDAGLDATDLEGCGTLLTTQLVWKADVKRLRRLFELGADPRASDAGQTLLEAAQFLKPNSKRDAVVALIEEWIAKTPPKPPAPKAAKSKKK